ncbi:hypothetical protein [Sporosarcina pasteurii]|uniref:Uncharacterized membrane protein yuaF n=1 Tax=Sporosarcina pasteurii TaxID=1474 RepID=A0A380CJL5_SPOPA|nr:hypothetical protein [Sporosarcina pasteurii]MDS9472091.1 hypothetical protein [Sporosarcina pasteurii]QBQ06812.1 hypothetical protein E2C16_14700 [Sporosarcina pasteurii]SUJ20820.1 Uncharacterized membrane protein yuaF [Sporosarcina pasteurii]
MELFGLPVVQVYLYVLIISGLITILYVFFSDVAEGIGEVSPFLDPAVILSFITFTSAAGYILELLVEWHSGVVLAVAIAIAIVLDILLYFFVLLPLASAEVSLAYTDESLMGQVGRVIVPIPVDGYGEIVIETINGRISKRATGYENTAIDYGKEVLIIEVKNGAFIVKEYEPFRFANHE